MRYAVVKKSTNAAELHGEKIMETDSLSDAIRRAEQADSFRRGDAVVIDQDHPVEGYEVYGNATY